MRHIGSGFLRCARTLRLVDVSIVVPARVSGARARAWEWLRRRYAVLVPDWELIEVDVDGEWSKGAVVNAGVGRASGAVLVVADADCVADHWTLLAAVDAARTTGWAVPFRQVIRLGRTRTDLVIAGDVIVTPVMVASDGQDPMRPPYPGKPGGGIVVVSRDAWAAVGGMDPRFLGWGGEDYALADALATCVGKPWRTKSADMWHLWHPPAPGYSERGMATPNRILRERYRGARHDGPTMRALIAEHVGEEPVGCGCNEAPTQPLPRAEASCLTCGLSFTSYTGPDGAEEHKARTGHVMRGLRGLRASERRTEPSDQFTGAGA